jgi:hypothetical protein
MRETEIEFSRINLFSHKTAPIYKIEFYQLRNSLFHLHIWRTNIQSITLKPCFPSLMKPSFVNFGNSGSLSLEKSNFVWIRTLLLTSYFQSDKATVI